MLNPGVTEWADGFLMAIRVDEGEPGSANITDSWIGFAYSADGISWEVDASNSIDRDRAIELLTPLEPHRDLQTELWRIYDPRLTQLDIEGTATLALSFAADTTHGLRPGLALSTDARNWRAISLGQPDDRNHVLFPERIDGAWWRLQRPMHEYGGAALGAGTYGVWAAASPDLVHWGSHRFICDRHALPFADDKVGPGAPPVRTEHGWLCVVHGVSVDPSAGKRGWEPSWHKTYEAGAVLLDLADPTRVIAASRVPVLTPEASYERLGFRNDVIFPSGALLVEETLHLYYGAADTVIGLATAPVGDIVDFVLSHAPA